mgnify:CR=1 FL=1
MVLTGRSPLAAHAWLVLLTAAGLAWLPGPGREVAAQGSGASATLRGRVAIQHPARDPARRPGLAELGSDLAYTPAERRQAVVYLESAPHPAFESVPPERASMKQQGERFVPHVLAIPAGSVVDFPNGDPFFHNVFSLSKPRKFDLGRYPRGQSRSVRFDEPGIVRVFCDIHSHMSAFILVFGHRFFAVTDESGRYRIDGVPPGRWTLVAWYEGGARESRPVAVPDTGGVIDVDFTLAGS